MIEGNGKCPVASATIQSTRCPVTRLRNFIGGIVRRLGNGFPARSNLITRQVLEGASEEFTRILLENSKTIAEMACACIAELEKNHSHETRGQKIERCFIAYEKDEEAMMYAHFKNALSEFVWV